MEATNPIINEFEDKGTSFKDFIAGTIPFGEYAQSEDYKRLAAAQRNFIAAVLRKESGAAISDQEFESGAKIYFPQPGDSDAVIKDKRRYRDLAVQGMKMAAGPGAAMMGTNDPLGLR
jgi:hypothetical protein